MELGKACRDCMMKNALDCILLILRQCSMLQACLHLQDFWVKNRANTDTTPVYLVSLTSQSLTMIMGLSLPEIYHSEQPVCKLDDFDMTSANLRTATWLSHSNNIRSDRFWASQVLSRWRTNRGQFWRSRHEKRRCQSMEMRLFTNAVAQSQ
jgi:hypothetical protein